MRRSSGKWKRRNRRPEHWKPPKRNHARSRPDSGRPTSRRLQPAQAPGRHCPPPRPSHTAQLAEAGDLRSQIGRRLCSTFGGRCGRHGCRPAGQSSERRRAADCRDPRAARAGPRRRIGARRTLVFERRTGGSRRQARAEDRRRRVGRRPAGHLRGRRRPAHGGDSGKGRACRVRLPSWRPYRGTGRAAAPSPRCGPFPPNNSAGT